MRTRWLSLFTFFLLGVGGVLPSRGEVLSLSDDSAVSLLGSATLHDWRCTTTQVSGEVDLDLSLGVIKRFLEAFITGEVPGRERLFALSREAQEHLHSASVQVDAEKFGCGNGAMEKDMKHALNTTRFPVVTYRYEHLAGMSIGGEEDRPVLILHTEGCLELAGVEKPVVIDLHATLKDDVLRLRAIHRLSMSAFGIVPPTAWFGLIRAHDPVDISFDLVLKPREGEPSVPE